MNRFAQLSPDEIKLILLQLDFTDLTQLCQSDKRFSQLCNDNLFRQRLIPHNIFVKLPNWSWRYVEELVYDGSIGIIPIQYINENNKTQKGTLDLAIFEPIEEIPLKERYDFFRQNSKIVLFNLFSTCRVTRWVAIINDYRKYDKDGNEVETRYNDNYDFLYISPEIENLEQLEQSIDAFLSEHEFVDQDDIPDPIKIEFYC